jgi:hypothetical protein
VCAALKNGSTATHRAAATHHAGCGGAVGEQGAKERMVKQAMAEEQELEKPELESPSLRLDYPYP